MRLFNLSHIECSAIVLHVAVKKRFDARWSRTRAQDVNISDVDQWINSSLRILQKLFSSILSIYCKNGSLAIFQAVKLFWLPSEKREIDLYILTTWAFTWAFSYSFPVCLALLMLVYFTTSDEKWKTKMMFWGKKSTQDLQEDFFQKVLTDQLFVVSRFLVCSQSPVFP